MRRTIVRSLIIAAIAVSGGWLPGSTPRAAAATPLLPGPCPGTQLSTQAVITQTVSGYPSSGYQVNGAIGYIDSMPAVLQPCYGAPNNGVSAILPANIQFDPANGDYPQYIVQLGIVRYSTDSSPWFVWTSVDDSGGYPDQATWFPQATPITGHEYFFMITNLPDGTSGRHYWQFCIEDVTLVLEQCHNSLHDSAWPDSGRGGYLYWSGYEIHTAMDVLGQLSNSQPVRIFRPEYRQTNSSSWHYLTQTQMNCSIYSPSPQSYYGCTNQAWNGYASFYGWSYSAGTSTPGAPTPVGVGQIHSLGDDATAP